METKPSKSRFAILNEALNIKGATPGYTLSEVNVGSKTEIELIIGTNLVPNEIKEFKEVENVTLVTITNCEGLSEKKTMNSVLLLNIFANYGPSKIVIAPTGSVSGPGHITISPGESKTIILYPKKDGSFKLY